MKHLCKTLATAPILAFSILNSPFSILNSSAAVRLEWTACPGEIAPAQFTRHHGETLELRCRFAGFGELPFSQGADIRLWYQTNGMPSSAWWSVPAQASSNTLSAVFAPECDPGADLVRLFFGAPSNVYASAVLRLRPSPGAAPNALPPPKGFAEADPVFAAWLATDPFSGLAPADYETVSNRAMSAVQPAEMNAAIAAIPSTDLTPATNYTDAALASATTNLARSVADRYLPLSGGIVRGNLQIGYAADNYAVGQRFVRVDVGGISIDEISDVQYIDVTGVDDQGREIHTKVPIPRAFSTPVWLQLPTNSGHIARTEDILWPVTTAKEEAFDYTDSAITATTNQLSSFAAHTNDTSNPHNVTASQIGAAPASLAQDVADLRTESALIYRLYSGSNVVFEVTNYNSQVHAPSMRLLQLNESNEYITVWTETNGLSRTLASARGYTDAATNALPATYAPRAWGRTTSGLGADAPDGTTWISTSNTVIAGGLEYQKNVTSAGAIWILTSNGMSADFHQQSNNVAYLDMSAADGTPIFRVEKTDSFLVGVHCDAVHVEDGDTLVCGVGVVANSHPYVRVRQSLTSGSWAKEEDGIPAGLATVEWSGTSGAWTCRIRNMTGGNSLFACMEYMQEGGVKVVNSAAMDVSTGGILCTDGVHKVRPVYNNGAITWEVVP